MTSSVLPPFKTPRTIAALTRTLTSDSIRPVLIEKDRTAREILARSWLTEGVPEAFASCPGIFDAIRVWLGARLDVSPKVITIVGSARTGFSLSPPPKYGTPFGPNSDLDLAIVSNDLFSQLVIEFESFSKDYSKGSISPRSSREAGYWQDNISRLPRNIRDGFIDAKYIPNLPQYVRIRRLSQTAWMLTQRVQNTPEAPKVTKSSVRVYRDWNALVDRVSFNLSTVLKVGLPNSGLQLASARNV
jgi:hypothetical protein